MVYYNEIDKYAAQWLRNLMAAGLIPAGEVDERSIEDVKPADLGGFTSCHFFAGIGGWAYALRLAGWPDDQPVWTGSCPCQPLSSAGQRKGHADKRHLWPAFHALISKCQPTTLFGEQVASKDGREWLAGIRADLEAVGYAVGAADLCAASVGAPHPRQRLYWVADPQHAKRRAIDRARNSHGANRQEQRKESTDWHGSRSEDGEARRLGHSDLPSEHGRPSSREQSLRDELGSGAQGLVPAESTRPQEQWSEYRPSGERCSGLVGFAITSGVPQWNGPTVAVECSDGARRVSAQPNAFPLAHGVSARMGKLRGAGNAIVPQVAAEFIAAYLEARAAA